MPNTTAPGGNGRMLCVVHSPRRLDFADMVEELVARKKMAPETMTQYFHEKLALCERCRFKGKKALSFIIRGLPLELQANARAFYAVRPMSCTQGSWLTWITTRRQVGEDLI